MNGFLDHFLVSFIHPARTRQKYCDQLPPWEKADLGGPGNRWERVLHRFYAFLHHLLHVIFGPLSFTLTHCWGPTGGGKASGVRA